MKKTIPPHLVPTIEKWKNGRLYLLRKGTFWRHRSQLLKHGIDIGKPYPPTKCEHCKKEIGSSSVCPFCGHVYEPDSDKSFSSD